jgi:hypothetical protein
MAFEFFIGRSLSAGDGAVKKISEEQRGLDSSEGAGYEGHSLSMLRHIARALKMRLKAKFIESPRRRIIRESSGTMTVVRKRHAEEMAGQATRSMMESS